MLTESIIVKL